MVTADIVDGKIVTGYTETDQSQKSSGSSLGKNEFLSLLVTQMQYQDPLNPTDNTEMVSQLAQFSALEEMQNVSSAVTNSQALTLVGKNVIIEVGKSSGITETTTVGGYVDYVRLIDGKPFLSIGDKLYDYADFDSVVDNKYLEEILGNNNQNNQANGSGETEEDKTEDTETGEENSGNTENEAEEA